MPPDDHIPLTSLESIPSRQPSIVRLAATLGFSACILVAANPVAIGAQRSGPQVQSASYQAAVKHLTDNFSPSFTAREFSDSLILPALLTHEALMEVADRSPSSKRSLEGSAICFDAYGHLVGSPHGDDAYALVRNWVGIGFYALGVKITGLGAERSFLTVQADGLAIASERASIQFASTRVPLQLNPFEKECGGRGPFTNLFGDYPLESIRFSEAEFALKFLLHRTLRSLTPFGSLATVEPIGPPEKPSITTYENLLDFAKYAPAYELALVSPDGRPLATHKWRIAAPSLDSGSVFQSICLQQQPVALRIPQPLYVKSPNGSRTAIESINGSYMAGGRDVQIQFESSDLILPEIKLPVSYRIFQSDNNSLLQSFTFTNFKRIPCEFDGLIDKALEWCMGHEY